MLCGRETLKFVKRRMSRSDQVALQDLMETRSFTHTHSQKTVFVCFKYFEWDIDALQIPLV